VTVTTGGYGGSKIRETVRIRTNDPKFPLLVVSVSGQVEKFAEIRPERVFLSGLAGSPISMEVEIIPRKEYPFTIQEVQAKDGRFIRWSLEKKCGQKSDRCVIKVESIRTGKGGFADILFVKTDSPVRPTISIYVTGSIR